MSWSDHVKVMGQFFIPMYITYGNIEYIYVKLNMKIDFICLMFFLFFFLLNGREDHSWARPKCTCWDRDRDIAYTSRNLETKTDILSPVSNLDNVTETFVGLHRNSYIAHIYISIEVAKHKDNLNFRALCAPYSSCLCLCYLSRNL